MGSDVTKLIELARRERVAVMKKKMRGECDGMTSPKCDKCEHAYYCQDLKHSIPRFFLL